MHSLIRGSALALLLAGSSAWAAGPSGDDGRMPGPPSAADLFSTLDSDGDGYISRDLWIEQASERAATDFDRMDSNGDSQLTEDELESGRPAFGPPPPRN